MSWWCPPADPRPTDPAGLGLVLDSHLCREQLAKIHLDPIRGASRSGGSLSQELQRGITENDEAMESSAAREGTGARRMKCSMS